MNSPISISRHFGACILGLVASLMLAACGESSGGGGVPNTFAVRGTVAGLTDTVVLQNNGRDDLILTAEGAFTFLTGLRDGSAYDVTILTQPTGQLCTISGGSGTIASADVTNIAVNCGVLSSIGGRVSGLTGSVVLQNNARDDMTLMSDGPFTFATGLGAGAAYDVTVLTQPAGQICSVTNGSGAVALGIDVTNVAVNCVAFSTVGGAIAGLTGSVVLQNNGGDDFTATANGAFAFSAPVADGSTYNVTVLSQPTGQFCTVFRGSGTLAGADVTDVAVGCVTFSTVGGTISGLTGTVVLQNNGGNDLTRTADGAFAFPTPLANGSTYNVTVLSQPARQVCTVVGGSGTLAGADITNIAVTCLTFSTVGGNITGLAGTVVLQINGGNNLTRTANGVFTFPSSLAEGSAYVVTVLTQPAGQTCTVTNGIGTLPSTNVTNVLIRCVSLLTVGGTVTGLSGSIVLQNNLGDDLTVTADGAFTFATPLSDGSDYSVTVRTQPPGQTCSVSNGIGTLVGSGVSSVVVTCLTFSTIGGNVTGLIGNVVLQNNLGDNLTVTADGAFTFATPLSNGSAYAVTVLSQPGGQRCTVTRGSGTLANVNITDVEVACVTLSTLGGNVTGLTGSVVLQNNLGDDLILMADGPFTFATSLGEGSAYAVSVLTQPAGQTCTVTNGIGTIAVTDINNVVVDCVTFLTIGGSVAGLTGNVVLQNNLGDDLTVTADGTFTFATALSDGSAYAVTVLTQPAGQTCTITNASGTLAGAGVTNVSVDCVTFLTIGGTLAGLTGNVVLQNNLGDDLTLTADGAFTFATPLADGSAYAVTVLTQPAGQTCTITNASGTLAGAGVTNVSVDCVTFLTIGGTLSDLSGSVVLQNNLGDDLTLTADGAFTFATPLADGSAYAVTVLTQPAGQTCTITNDSGTLAGAGVTNVSVDCVTFLTIGGTLAGLTGSVVLQNNLGDDLTLTADGAFTFATPLADGSAYAVSVLTQPVGQTCTITNDSGTLAGAAVTNVAVDCVTFLTIGGTVAGLTGSVVLQNNLGDDLTLTADGAFTFATQLADGSAYAVSVLTQPAGQTCTVTNASGTLAGAGVTNVAVSCVSFLTVGGTLTGLTGSVVLQNNLGDDLTLTADGAFTFATPLADGSAYAVSVLTQPVGQTCTITNDSGTLAGAGVTNVSVDCVTFLTIGGTVAGLTGNVVLQNNLGDDLTVTADGAFTFATALADGSAYAVTVLTQPAGQTCTVTNASGTLAGAGVTNVAVDCVTFLTIGGTVAGLTGNVVLQNNLGDDLTVTADGAFTFATALADGSAYAVTVLTQPAGQTCTVTNASGTLAGAGVTNVAVDCVTFFTIGGTLSGLSGSVVLQNNLGDDLTVTADGAFSFATALADGSAYAVTVLTQPAGQTCTVTNASGTVAGADVSDVEVSCITFFTIGGTLTGLTGSVVLQNNLSDDLTLTADGSFTFARQLADGFSYSITVLTQPVGQTCTVTSESGTLAGADVTDVAVDCVSDFSVGGSTTGLTGSLVLQNNAGDNLPVTADGAFTFTTRLADGSAYTVTVLDQPSGQMCTVTNETGTLAGADVTNVAVGCVAVFTVGGDTTGLTGTLVLQNNAGDDLSLTVDGDFTFATPLLDGSTYRVTVLTQPAGQTCTVTAGDGTIAAANVSDVAVSCTAVAAIMAYVANQNSEDITTYSIDPATGAMTEVDAQVAWGVSPDAVTVDPTGRFAYSANVDSDDVTTFSVDPTTGALTEVGTPVAAGVAPQSVTLDPTGRFAYVANSESNTVTTFRIDSTTGALTEVGSEVPTNAGPLSVTVHPTGRFAYVANSRSGDVTTFRIDSRTGALTEVGTAVAVASVPQSVTLDPAGRFAYVANLGSDDVSTFSIDAFTGALTAVGTEVVAGEAPSSVAIEPTGRFAYVTNFNSDDITIFRIDPATGALTHLDALALAGDGPVSITIIRPKRLVDTINGHSNDIPTFGIDPTTGALTVAGIEVAVATTPRSVSVAPTGRFAYVANGDSDAVTIFSINASTGALTEVGAGDPPLSTTEESRPVPDSYPDTDLNLGTP